MKRSVRFPIRRKILLSLSLTITAVVSLITFTMARFFHEDKRAYINDWVSIAAVSTADECRSLLTGYRQRLTLYSEIVLNESLPAEEKSALLATLFDELPELVGVALYRDGEELETADDSAVLEDAGLSHEQLQAYRDEHPLAIERLAADETFIDNATISAELPSFVFAFARESEDDLSPVVVEAILQLEALQRAGAKFKVFETTIAAASGTLLVHPDASLVAGRVQADLRDDARRVFDAQQAGMTLEYEHDGVTMLGGFASVEPGGLVVAVQIPKSAAYLASRELLGRLTLVALMLMFTASIAGLVWARRLTRPVESLSSAARRIGRGEFDLEVDVHSRDEMGALAQSFNQMTGELKSRDVRLTEAHSQLVQSEKMAAFGQLGAGIAHEVKNPLAGVLGCAQLSLMDVEEGSSVHENLVLIEKETTRCKEIIENLLKFARQEKTMLEPTDVTQVARDAGAIVNHQLELAEVKLHFEIEPGLPLILGNGNQLQQVLINLLINAQQAMDGKPGNVHLSAHSAGDSVEIVVRDEGPGIPQDIQEKLFEPFFTTKPTGKGTGLGLSVSFGIIKDHQGDITIDSEPGRGAAFVIRIPALEMAPEAALLEQLDGSIAADSV